MNREQNILVVGIPTVLFLIMILSVKANILTKDSDPTLYAKSGDLELKVSLPKTEINPFLYLAIASKKA